MFPSNTVRRYFDIARQEALLSPFYRRHGAVLVRGGRIINKSYNSPNFSSFAKRFCIQNGKDFQLHAFRHAELSTVLGVPRDKTEGSSIYVVRINRHGEFKMSRPCSLCLSALKFVGVKRAFYTISPGEMGVIKL